MSDIVNLTFQNAGASTLGAGVATLGQVFLPGEVPAGSGLIATSSSGNLAVQLDVKTRYADGSVKMAVLSIDRPDIAAGGHLDVTLANGTSASSSALDLSKALAGHSFQVDVSVGGAHTGVDVLAALQKGLADGSATFWQQGELATQARVEVPLDGSQRMIFDVTAYKDGGFAVDAQFNNDRAMEAEGGRVSYDVVVTMDGKEALRETVNQGQYQNWHESFASNATDGGQGTGSPEAGWLNIQQDIARLQQAGVVANYDLGLKIDAGILSEYSSAMQAADWGEPLSNNGVALYMPGAGGRADIGFTTEANTVWLISQNPQAAAYAMGQAEAAGSVPWNFWDAKNGSWLSTDDYPAIWTDGRGGTGTPGDRNSTGLTQQVDGQTGWTTDPAHEPNLSFVPYVLTGERWILDNLQAQASWNIVNQLPSVRGNADDNLIHTNQVRGAAWALREVDNAAWAAPDGSPEKAYLQAASNDNYAWLVSKIPEWTAQQGEAHGWVPGTYGADGALPPWQQDYFASTVIAAASRGNADALTFLEWQSNFLVGRFTHASEGFDLHDGAAYLLAISDETPGAAPYTTWEQIGAQMDARGWSNNDGWANSQGDYAQLALATLSGIYRLTGSAEAKAAYEALMADGAPFASSADLARDPTYAIAAPGVETTKPVIPEQPTSPTTPEPAPEPPPVPTPEPTPTPDPTPDTTPAPDAAPEPTPTPDPAPTPDTTPTPAPDLPSTEPGDELASLAVVLGADSWDGDPLAVIRVDGQEVFRGAISAQHADGGQRVELGQFASDQAHAVTVEFLNDAWGGSPDADRNLHLESVLVNGVSTGQGASLLHSGETTFHVGSQAPNPDVLRVSVSGDAWNGNARFLLFVDGVQMGSERVASASHAAGEAQVVELQGDFGGGGGHELAVRFLNDAWGGSAEADRNLYVDKVEFNGVDQQHHAALLNNGDAIFAF